MTGLPQTSPIPQLVFLPPQSPRLSGPGPTSSPIPIRDAQKPFPLDAENMTKKHHTKKPVFPLPKLRLEIRDLSHGGAQIFLESVVASKALSEAVESVLRLLYQAPGFPTTTVPTTRSVTLVLKPMGGVAYTTGSELDDDHKEIHFSLDYIHNSVPKKRRSQEIMGVLTHEMVHCYQYNAFGTCPGGLIEGIADWVRLNANLSPPHWKKEASGKWDAGYQHTGYFLEYLEKRFGKGTVMRLNEKLRIERYDEKRFWTEVCGRPVEQLWGDYQQFLKNENKTAEESEFNRVDKKESSDGTRKPTETSKLDEVSPTS